MSRIFVDYLGQRVGALAEARGSIFFEYDPGLYPPATSFRRPRFRSVRRTVEEHD